MILTTHIVAGAAVAKPFIEAGHPVVGIVAAIGSHFVIDMIPHWDYELASIEKNEDNRMDDKIANKSKISSDLLKICSDVTFGFLLVYFSSFFILKSSIFILLVSAGLAAAFPDFLQAVYWFYRKFPIIQLKKFHHWVHSERRLKLTTTSFMSQAAIIILAIELIMY